LLTNKVYFRIHTRSGITLLETWYYRSSDCFRY